KLESKGKYDTLYFANAPNTKPLIKQVKSDKWESYYQNGNPKKKGTYQKDQEVRLHIEWYENNQKKSEINYSDKKKNGYATHWFKNGRLERKYSMCLIYDSTSKKMVSKMDGHFENYRETGEPQSVGEYKN